MAGVSFMKGGGMAGVSFTKGGGMVCAAFTKGGSSEKSCLSKGKIWLRLMIVMLSVWLLVACKEEVQPVPVIRPVVTQTVDITENWQEATYAGEVKARYKMALGFRIGGKVVERFVEVGNVVVPGALLARLDPDDSQLQLMEAKGGLEAARAEKKKAELDLKRYTKLYREKMISAAEHLQFTNVLEVAKARLKQAEAHLEVSRNQADYTHLYADKGGVITALDMEVGQVVVAGQTVVNVALPEEKEVVIAVAENRLDEIRQADEIKISLWIDPDTYYRGRVREVSPGADPVTRTYSVKISLMDNDPRIQLGMTTTVRIAQKKKGKVARLPLNAIYQKDSNPAVWIYSPEKQQVSLQLVEVLEYQYDAALIKAGLTQGQVVVVAGVNKLYEGQKVRLMEGR